MMLSDWDIMTKLRLGDIVIRPFEDWMLQPASVDIQLGNEFMWYRAFPPDAPLFTFDVDDDSLSNVAIDPFMGVDEEREMVRQTIKPGDTVVLEPGEFCLATTKQYIEVPPTMVLQ